MSQIDCNQPLILEYGPKINCAHAHGRESGRELMEKESVRELTETTSAVDRESKSGRIRNKEKKLQ